jgi:hypothetical protein
MGLCANAATFSYDKCKTPAGTKTPVMKIRIGVISAATNPPAAKGSHKMGLLDRAMV